MKNDGDPQEYLVTQQLSAAVKAGGYDGIRYRSTRVDRGANLVLLIQCLGLFNSPRGGSTTNTTQWPDAANLEAGQP